MIHSGVDAVLLLSELGLGAASRAENDCCHDILYTQILAMCLDSKKFSYTNRVHLNQ